MIRRFKTFSFPIWTIPLAAAALGVLSYGVLIPGLGFYWDDLAYQYAYHVFGPGGFQAFVALDRPFSYFIYILTSSLFGMQPAFYQVFNLLLRVSSAAAAWWMLSLLWPGRRVSLAWLPLAFVVYPGFLQQPVAFIYNLHWINFLQTLLSLGFMLLALRAVTARRRAIFTALALLFSLNIFSLEYSFGLEALRPLLIFLVLGERNNLRMRQRLLATLRWWLPYLAVAAAYLLWSLLIFNNARYEATSVTGLASAPLATLPALLQRIIRDLAQVVISPWLGLFAPLYTFKLASASDLLYWLVALASGIGLAVYLVRINPGGDLRGAAPQEQHSRYDPGQDRWARQALLVAVWVLLPTGLPFWAVGLDIEPRFPYDRFTMPFILGVSLLLAALLELLIKTRARRAAVFSILIGLAVAFQFQNTNTYRREWSSLNSFLWQLTWRAPAIQPGTLLMTHDLPFQYYSDNSLSGVLNLSYAPGQKNDPAMPYMLIYLYDRQKGSLTSLAPGTPYTKPYRSLRFKGNTSQALVLYYSPPGCLRLLDPARSHELPDLPPIYQDVLPLSDLGRVETAPASPAVPFPVWFKPQAGGWCQAFEQADLARQSGDWEAAARLAGEALARGEQPSEPSELGVLIEAQARLGRLDQAAQETAQALSLGKNSEQFACREWQYLQEQGLAAAGEREKRFPELSCGASETLNR